MPKIVIKRENLPPINAEKNSYFVRYRLISEDRNTFSYWSPVYEIPSEISYTSETLSVTYSGSILSAVWSPIDGVDEYDVWTSWTNGEEKSIIQKERTTTKLILTTSSNHGYLVGDSVFVSGVGSPYDGLKTIANVTSNTISFDSTAANSSTASLVTPNGLVTKSYQFYKRVPSTFINLLIPSGSTKFSIKIYVPVTPTGYGIEYEQFKVFQKLNTAVV